MMHRLILALFAFFILKKQWRRKKEGYFVDLSPTSADDGTIIYNEAGKTLKLDYYLYEGELYSPVIYVPTNETWQEIMPEWAKDRREEITFRIKKHWRKWRIEVKDSVRDFKIYEHVIRK